MKGRQLTETERVFETALMIKGRLLGLGWSQAEFARRIGVDENTVSKWMNGKARPSQPALAYLRLASQVASLAGDLGLRAR